MLIFDIKVVPSAGRTGWTIDKAGQLKCFLKSPPKKGKANKELVATLAKALKVPQQDITIISGLTSRKKRIQVAAALTREQLLDTLGLAQQMSLV